MLEKLKKLPIATHFRIQIGIMVAGIFIGAVSSQFDFTIGTIIGFVLMIGSFVWHGVFLRCPHCGHHFHFRQAIPKFCPNCGKQVLD